MEQQSQEYKGYVITRGSIHKNGEQHWMFYVSIDAPNEEYFSEGKKIIDEHLSRV